MGTRYGFKRAVRITQNLSPTDKTLVKEMCRAIQKSQKALLYAAQDIMFKSIQKCRGLCCKNLDIDSIFSLWDFIYILTLEPGMKDEIQERLDTHTSLYLSPCPFLRDNEGPCIFPDTVKAQICVTTFCSDDQTIRPFIKTVNLNFYKLCWLVQYLRLKRTIQKMVQIFSGPRPQ